MDHIGTRIHVIIGLVLSFAIIVPPAGSSPVLRMTAHRYLPVVLAEPSVRLGFHISIWEWESPRAEEQITLAAQTGARVIRLPISWHLLQPDGPLPLNSLYTDHLKRIIGRAHALHLDVLLMMADPPAWAVDQRRPGCQAGRQHWCVPTHPEAYAQTFKLVLDAITTWSYAATVRSIEIWNEPNYRADTPDRPFTAAEYAALLNASYRLIKPAYPAVQILGGALAGTDTEYLQELYRAGAQNSFDILSVHPYTRGNIQSPDYCGTAEETDFRWSYRCGVEHLRSVMTAAPWFDNRPLWFTEFGWSSFAGGEGVGIEAQRTYMARALRIIGERQWSYVKVALWYNLVDCTDRPEGQCESHPPQTPPAVWHAFFGLYNKDLTSKPAVEFFKIPPPIPPVSVMIEGNDDQGIYLYIAYTGTYRFVIEDGVYSPWPQDNSPNNQWRSILYGYRNRAIEWQATPGGQEPANPSFQIGLWEQPGQSYDAARAAAQGVSIELSLNAGDILAFVPIDIQGLYGDNRGFVRIRGESPIPAFGPSPRPASFPISIQGDLEQGLPLITTGDGLHTFTFANDVYSPWSSQQSGNNQWRSIVFGYRNRPILWGPRSSVLEPIDPDFQVGRWDSILPETEAAAINASHGFTATIDLSVGDRLLLVPIDQQGTYHENRGQTAYSLQLNP
jgi:hypothetical protein